MPVVINEFETVPRTERAAESDSGGGGGEGASPEHTEHEIEKMMELHASRCERLRAY